MKRPVRFAIMAGACLLISAVEPDAATFCERLAPQLGLKEVQARSGKSTYREWKAEQMGLLKKHLIGGSTMVSFGVVPGSTGDANADTERAVRTCQQVKKSLVCRAQAPDTLTVSTPKGEARETVRVGESPVVEFRGTAVVCRNS